MDPRRYRQKVDMFNEGSVGKLKSKYDTFKSTFMADYHRQQIQASRNGQRPNLHLNKISQQTKEFNDHENNTGESQSKMGIKLQSFSLYDQDFSKYYHHFVFRMDFRSEFILIEFRKAAKDNDKVVKYRLELSFKRIKEFVVVAAKNAFVIIFDKLTMTKESIKKKQPSIEKYPIRDQFLYLP